MLECSEGGASWEEAPSPPAQMLPVLSQASALAAQFSRHRDPAGVCTSSMKPPKHQPS